MCPKRNDSVFFFKKMGSSEMFRVRFCWRRERIKRKLQLHGKSHPRSSNERGCVGKKTLNMEHPPVWRSISDFGGDFFTQGVEGNSGKMFHFHGQCSRWLCAPSMETNMKIANGNWSEAGWLPSFRSRLHEIVPQIEINNWQLVIKQIQLGRDSSVSFCQGLI